MDLADPGDPELLFGVCEMISPTQPEKLGFKMKRSKKKREEGRLEEAEADPRACKSRKVI
jgi:hypothetical protein